MARQKPDICLEDMAAELGITVSEAQTSIERLVAQGWLRPATDGTYQLTKPGCLPPGLGWHE